MGLGEYAAECESLAEELLESLTKTEIAALHKLLAGRTLQDWSDLRYSQKEQISAYVKATPSKRKAGKFKNDRLILTMAGIQHCLEARALLTVIEDSFLEPGGSYRDMAARAGDAFDKLFGFVVPAWPFAELDSPFVDDCNTEYAEAPV